MMVIWISDSDNSDEFEGDWDDDKAELSSSPALRNPDAPGPSSLLWQVAAGERANGAAPSTYSVEKFVEMGFPREMVLKGMNEIGNTSSNGGRDENTLLELLLTYKALGDDPLVGNCSISRCIPQTVKDDEEDDFECWDDDDACERDPDSDGSGDVDFLKKIKYLVNMGFPEDEANMAITRCGLDAAISVLVDSIYASQSVGDNRSMNLSDHEIMDNNCFDSPAGRKRSYFLEDSKKKRKLYGGGAQGNQAMLDCSYEDPITLPNPMVGFNLPSDPFRSVNRKIPQHAMGPPFFYFENVALAPKGVWTKISRFLYGIKPEFVDSKFLCAAARKRGYIHNLPVDNRSALLPLPPKTIFKAFPHYEKWWPPWDSRRQLNCLNTRAASAELVERIRRALADSGNRPDQSVRKYVLGECRKWNLVWIGKHKVAPLEPREVEYLLGFPEDHTRGFAKAERYKSLGNSFHVDTVAYHLSVLKKMFPNGINVLSLFSGIGGAKVALHRLGIHMKVVVSVETSAVNRSILKSWWDQSQKGELIEIDGVESLTEDIIESLVGRFGGFHLVIGGSPCNNLTGSNRYHRDGLEGEQSVLFHDYVRILNSVKSIMLNI